MRITIFGSTGQLGRLIIYQALEKGHDVVAFARSSSKLNLKNNKLRVIEGDVTDIVAVESAIKDSEAVISALNTNNLTYMPISSGVNNILISMNKYNVQRLVMSAPVPGVVSPNDTFSIKFSLVCGLIKIILKTFSRKAFIDLKTSCEIVQNSNTNWTLVRIFPTNKPKKNNIKSGFINSKMGLTITRSDTATFMLNILDSNDKIRQTLFISN